MKRKIIGILFIVFICLMGASCQREPTKKYIISFNGGTEVTGTDVADIEAKAGAKIILPANTYVKDGYEFKGWELNNLIYQPGSEFTVPESNVEFVAVWENITTNKYIISFNGGPDTSGTQMPNIEAYAGETITLPVNAYEKEGYEFKGWKLADTIYQPGNAFVVPESNVEFVATWELIPPTTYTVSFKGGEGASGDTIIINSESGVEITLPENTFSKEKHAFIGWVLGDITYQPGNKYLVGETNITFIAKWVYLSTPTFSQLNYEYDKLGGGDCELPLDLDESNLFMVKINNELLNQTQYGYDEAKKVLIIREEVLLKSSLGSYEIIAVTDADITEDVKCTLTIVQSLKTTFDEITTKQFELGKDVGIKFNIGFNGTTVKKLVSNENVIDESFYIIDTEGIIIKSEYLKIFGSTMDFDIYLSNNDCYSCSVTTNVMFATDYDNVTIHNETASNLGHNPLYQYYDNVSIVFNEAMNSTVLKIVPNTVDVTYDCHGYLTLRTSEWDSLWYLASFTPGKKYIISFDYMTENTTGSEMQFYYGSVSTGYRDNLLLGPDNNGKIHHFTKVMTYGEIGNGLFLWAKFIGGSGIVYVDNFKIAQYDEIPTIASASLDYEFEVTHHDYKIAFNNLGWAFDVLLNGAPIEYSYDAVAKEIVLPQALMETLEAKKHTLNIRTDVLTLQTTFRVVDNTVAEFTNSSVDYFQSTSTEVKLMGSFSSGLTISRLQQIDKNYDNGYAGGWDFAHNNTEKNYNNYVQLVHGEGGTGYILLNKEFCDLFWGSTEFQIEFSNGIVRNFILNSPEVIFFSNYDDTTIRGELNGSFKDSPLESGMWGGAQINVESRNDGMGKAWFIRKTTGAADACAYSIRFHAHPWEWYNLPGVANKSYRVTFEYQISNLDQNSVYFYIMVGPDENINNIVLGEYDSLDYVPGDHYYKVRYNLIADGQVHQFDSGYFVVNPSFRMMKIQLPFFDAAENKFIMFDNYRVTAQDLIVNPLSAIGNYQLYQSEPLVINEVGTISGILIDNVPIAYTTENGQIILNSDELNLLSIGAHNIVVNSSVANFKGSINVVDNRISTLSENYKYFVHGIDTLKISGEFSDTLVVTSITRKGTNFWDTSKDVPVEMDTSYIEVQNDGLLLKQGLLYQAYDRTTYVVSFDNGKSVEFVLENNALQFTNYDETDVHAELFGNSATCQDSDMWSIIDVAGNRKIKYQPENATLWHSTQAINGNGKDNFIYTFENRHVNNYNWWDHFFNGNETLIIYFDYEIFVPDGKTSHYLFTWIDMDQNHHTINLNGSGQFYLEIPANNLRAWGMNCPAASPDLITGSYMLLDNYGFALKTNDNYLTEFKKNVVHQGTTVKLAGVFDSSLTITSLKRGANNFWDNGKFNAVEIATDLIELNIDGITISQALINMIYGTQTFWVTLSNNDVIRFQLVSNVIHATNYDEVSVHEAATGNIRSCQDTSMWSVIDIAGNHKLKYQPENATLGHSTQANNGNGGDNGILTFSNTTNNNHWWWEYAFPTTGTIFVYFDYEVVLGEKTDSYYKFQWLKLDGENQTWVDIALTETGSLYVEMPANQLIAFRIHCPVATPEMNAGTYVLVDNFGFGVK